MTTFVVLSCLLLAMSVANVVPSGWQNWKSQHNRVYDASEEQHRSRVFRNNLAKIVGHNMEAAAGKHTYSLALNKFADLTQEEMIGRYNALAINATNLKRKKVRRINRIEDLPDSVDWRKEGLVTPVQDQGKCGSGWAFAAVAATEGLHAKLFKNLTGLSAQNLIDCSRVDNQGCRGGLVDRAFDYIIENDGIDTEQSYSYKARDGKCRFKRRNVGATIDSYADIEFGDVNTLQQAVAAVGPIAVGIDASAYTFHFYSHGVYSDSQCSAWALNHAVTAVGYGALDGSAYWLVKNSWGTDWGQEGYILMARNGDNFCGIASAASYPLIKE